MNFPPSAPTSRPPTSTAAPPTIALGTVAIEPNRWATVHADRRPTVQLIDWLDAIAAAGFEAIEVWEPHVKALDSAQRDVLAQHPLAVEVFNSYVSLDEVSPTERNAATGNARSVGSTAIKFNVGNHAAASADYIERISSWLDASQDQRLLCECHHGISIAEDPQVAAAIFAAAGPPERLQAIVHTHEDDDHLRARFDAYGERITHTHVNFLDFKAMTAPRLCDIRARLQAKVGLLQSLGFDGSWTIEFVHGLLSDNDEPTALVAQAADDLAVLREVLP